MKLYNLVKPTALSLLFTAPLACIASAESLNNYVTVKAGLSQSTELSGSKFNFGTGKPTYIAGIAVGRKFMDHFGVELEYMHSGNRKYKSTSGFTSGSPDGSRSWGVMTDSFMLNFSADLPTESTITPYVKVGLGASRNSADKLIFTSINAGPTNSYTYAKKAKTNFAYQGGAGLNVALNPRSDVQLEYMFINRGKMESNAGYRNHLGDLSNTSALKAQLYEHIATIGLKIKF